MLDSQAIVVTGAGRGIGRPSRSSWLMRAQKSSSTISASVPKGEGSDTSPAEEVVKEFPTAAV